MKVKMVVKAKNSWSKLHRDVVAGTVAEAIKFYGLDEDVHLTVKLLGHTDEWGAAVCLEHKKKYHIWIHGGYSIKRTVSSVFHEMTHIKQFLRDGFRDIDGTVFWKYEEREYNEDKDYWTAPWEVEARRMEKKLTKRYMK